MFDDLYALTMFGPHAAWMLHTLILKWLKHISIPSASFWVLYSVCDLKKNCVPGKNGKTFFSSFRFRFLFSLLFNKTMEMMCTSMGVWYDFVVCRNHLFVVQIIGHFSLSLPLALLKITLHNLKREQLQFNAKAACVRTTSGQNSSNFTITHCSHVCVCMLLMLSSELSS